jgi:hypothetical protein
MSLSVICIPPLWAIQRTPFIPLYILLCRIIGPRAWYSHTTRTSWAACLDGVRLIQYVESLPTTNSSLQKNRACFNLEHACNILDILFVKLLGRSAAKMNRFYNNKYFI